MVSTYSKATQDYLKVIYDITAAQERASTNEIADRLQFKPASVTGMVQKLATQNLVDYKKRVGAKLTAEGVKAALVVIRHHRILETFLHQELGYGWDEVHAEAEVLEHAVNEKMSRRMADLMGNPRRDPHGDPIPTRDLVMPKRCLTTLSDCEAGQTAAVVRVQDEDSAFLRHVANKGLVPQARLTIVEVSSFDQTIIVQVNNRLDPMTVGLSVGNKIFVKILEREKA